MSLFREWKQAKKRYDAAREDARRCTKDLKEELKAAYFFQDAVREGRLRDESHMRKIHRFVKRFSPRDIKQKIRDLDRELQENAALTPLPKTGIAQALQDLDRVLEVAEGLISKGDMEVRSWDKYRELHDGCTRRLMTANDSFEAFNSRWANLSAKQALRRAHESILKQVGDRSRAVHEYLHQNRIPG